MPNQDFLFKNFIGILLILQAVLYVTFFFDFPLVRQVVGIGYLTFVPGIVFVKLLNIKKLSIAEFTVLSVGFSLAFIMLAGLVLNEIGVQLGIASPIASFPLSIFINTLVLVGAAVAYRFQEKTIPAQQPTETFFHPLMVLFAVLPALSIAGTYLINAYNQNFLLIIMFLSVAMIVACTAFVNGKVMRKIYPFAIFMIALALLFQFSLLSGYIQSYGGDSSVETYVLKETLANGQWSMQSIVSTDQSLGRYNAMLSITILPTTYANVAGLNPDMVYKIVYPIIFALIPVALFLIWGSFLDKKFAFFAAFLFMAQSTFYTEMLALNRQIIGELFFALLLFVLLSKKISPKVRFVSFAVFSLGLIFSHYALAEIFILFIVAAWITSVFIIKRPSVNLKVSMLVFFFAAMFGWYIYTSGAVVFDSFIEFASYVGSQFGDFFDPMSRGTTVLTGMGLTESPSFLNTISRMFAYVTEIFIVTGIIALLQNKTRFVFERDYKVYSLIAAGFLVSLTIIPGLANTLNMTRFYHLLLMVLAPFCIIGAWAIVKLLTRHEKELVVSLLIVAVLVPYFLFQSNVVYEIAGTQSWSLSLSKDRMDPVQLYGDFGWVNSAGVYSAQWVSNQTAYEYNMVADSGLYSTLTPYGQIYRGYITPITNYTVLTPGEYVYFSSVTMNSGNLPIFSEVLDKSNVIYSNGESQVFYVPK
ncbi:MAG: DUF2206 domain-containing protein [Candidatus Bathyarchaeota archaeon]|nr:DUF2206 domain-containing protein [Candidatus Bathyarchaeota archaeon]